MQSINALDLLKAILSCNSFDGRIANHAIITEGDPKAKLKKITISNISGDILLLLIDDGRKHKKTSCMSTLFKDLKGYDHNRACDAVLIRKQNGDTNDYAIYYIELKSDSPSGYENQFKSTQCFMSYVFDICDKLNGCKITINKTKFIVFHTDSNNLTRSGRKRITQHTPSNANSADKPVKIIVHNNDTISFQKCF